MNVAKQKYYAVYKGRQPGVFTTWSECEQQTKGFAGAKFKSFATKTDAEEFARTGIVEESAAGSGIDLRDGRIHVFVDGSYANGTYSWGMAIYHDGVVFAQHKGVGQDKGAASMHNVAGEIQGAMEAAQWAHDNGEKIRLYHDYNGIAMWAQGRWKTNNEYTRAYAEFMKAYLPLIEFVKVAGHTGIAGNELADKLAKQALAEAGLL